MNCTHKYKAHGNLIYNLNAVDPYVNIKWVQESVIGKYDRAVCFILDRDIHEDVLYKLLRDALLHNNAEVCGDVEKISDVVIKFRTKHPISAKIPHNNPLAPCDYEIDEIKL